MIAKNEKRFCILCSALILSLISIILFTMYLINYFIQSRQENAVYEEIKDSAVIISGNSLENISVTKPVDTTTADRTVDFDYLEDINPAISSWIFIPGTVVDYPVVQGIDNTVYLNHDAYGNTSSSGAIFIDCLNCPYFTDYHTIIYGHNKRDGSMFNILHSYTDPDFADKHSTMGIYMDNGEIHTYQLLCTLTANGYDEKLYTKDTLSNDELITYLLAISDCIYNTDNGHNLVSLSTCISGDSRRVVVFQETLNY